MEGLSQRESHFSFLKQNDGLNVLHVLLEIVNRPQFNIQNKIKVSHAKDIPTTCSGLLHLQTELSFTEQKQKNNKT